MAGAVAHPVEVVLTAAERAQDLANDRQVAALAVGANQVGLAHAAVLQDRPHRRAVVLDADPVADVEAVAVEHGAPPIDQARHLTRDELLHVLVGAVVVRADGYGCPESVRARPDTHEHVSRRLGRAVRATRAVRTRLRETTWIIKLQIVKDLVGAHLMEPHNMTTSLTPQDCAGLSDQHEGRVVSQGNCGGDVYGAVDQQARDCDRSGTGGERGRERPCATRGYRHGGRVGHRHARQVARAHKGREHVAGAPELDALLNSALCRWSRMF